MGFGTIRYKQHEFDYENVVTPLWRDFHTHTQAKILKITCYVHLDKA